MNHLTRLSSLLANSNSTPFNLISSENLEWPPTLPGWREQRPLSGGYLHIESVANIVNI